MAYATLSALALEFYTLSRNVGLVLELPQVQQLSVDAARFYAAYGRLSAYGRVPASCEVEKAATFANVGQLAQVRYPNIIEVGANLLVSMGEWGLIRPLFALYVERENAMHLEASRQMGVDVYGRSVSEITQDITLAEEALRGLAFSMPIFSA